MQPDTKTEDRRNLNKFFILYVQNRAYVWNWTTRHKIYSEKNDMIL